MRSRNRIVIVGATSGIAEHCARLWVKKKDVDLTLVGRDFERTERVASDLRVRSPQSDIHVLQGQFHDPMAIQALVDTINERGPVNVVLIAHGTLTDQETCQADLSICRETLEINGISPVLYAEAFARQMTKINSGTIALISSVAGDRGRKSNYAYGAAKGMVSLYAQGMQHRFTGSGVKIVLLKPGPTDTAMTASLKQRGMKLAPVEAVAQSIVDAIENGKSTAYVPGKWRLIMSILRHMPASIFNRLDI
ncbi:MAG: SDR family NAD(P)-dependent oxidoreductase [Sterolibacterium sp.]